jgi:FkbM family methyltransferase
MRLRLVGSKANLLAYRTPKVAEVDVPELGGKVWLRSHTSDMGVLSETLVGGAYRALDDYGGEVHTIVDLGANNGLVARWLLQRYPAARIVCVEPEPGNVEMLWHNLASYHDRASVVEKCIGAAESTTALETDAGEWGYRMAGRPGDIEVTTMNRLVDDYDLDRIDLLKCDIEGAERDMFAHADDWLDRVRFAVVECHDIRGEEIAPPGWRVVDSHGWWERYRVETVALTPARFARGPTSARAASGSGRPSAS